MTIKSYRDLEVWKKALDLSVLCYELTRTFPKEELYSLTGQIKRSAISVPANIAEGHSRGHTKEFIQFLNIAAGSLSELETHLIIAEKLRFLEKGHLKTMLDKTGEVGKMIHGLLKALGVGRKTSADILPVPKP